MKNEAIRSFLGANTGMGFYSLYDSLTDPARGEGRWIIKAGPGGGKSSFLKRVGSAMEASGEEVEYIYCSGYPDSLDGIRLGGRGLALVDGTAPHAAVTAESIGREE